MIHIHQSAVIKPPMEIWTSNLKFIRKCWIVSGDLSGLLTQAELLGCTGNDCVLVTLGVEQPLPHGEGLRRSNGTNNGPNRESDISLPRVLVAYSQ